MIRRVLFALLGIVALSSPVLAQPPVQLLHDGNTPDRQPWSSLENQDRFFFATAFGSPRPTSYYLPPFYAWEPSGPYRSMPGQRNVVEELTDLRAPSRIHFGGEIGFLYGKSSGTYGREDFAGYIIGTVGNEKFSITAGYYRQETNFETPRHRR